MSETTSQGRAAENASADAGPLHVDITIHADYSDGRSSRTAITAMLLCVIGGVFGVHRLYLGKVITAGIMVLLTLSFAGLLITIPWAIVDFTVLLFGMGSDSSHRPLRYFG